MRPFSPERREQMIDTFVGAVVVVAGTLVASWVFVALIVGSIDLARWLEGVT